MALSQRWGVSYWPIAEPAYNWTRNHVQHQMYVPYLASEAALWKLDVCLQSSKALPSVPCVSLEGFLAAYHDTRACDHNKGFLYCLS